MAGPRQDVSGQRRDILHASCVSLHGRGCLILGPSGSGKSSLALHLMSLGADLVADDRTEITREGDSLLARCPETIAGRIEARGVGILRLPFAPRARLSLAVDLGVAESQRLPEPHVIELLGLDLPCLHNPATAHFPHAIRAYLSQTQV